MNAAIISVGNELLLGKTLNTNLTTLAPELFSLGIKVKEATCIEDDEQEIHSALKKAEHLPLIIFTGGLGPTLDDTTKESVASFYSLPLSRDERSLKRINAFFDRVGRPMKDANLKQADFPAQAHILDNDRGTAPGVIIPVNNQHIVLLPGPPHELRGMLPQLKDYLKPLMDETFYQRGLLVVGRGESDMEEYMKPFYEGHEGVTVAPYAGVGEIKYLFTSQSKAALDAAIKEFKRTFGNAVVGTHEKTLEEHVVHTLADQNKSIAVVESITGGMIASRLVNVPGASKVFNESYVLYSNESKMRQMGINEQILKQYGAVSEQCVYDLAYQLSQRSDADVSLSVSGVAGPSGGSDDKPVGLVYFAVHHEGTTKTYKRHFPGDRTMIRIRASAYALFLVMKALMHDEN